MARYFVCFLNAIFLLATYVIQSVQIETASEQNYAALFNRAAAAGNQEDVQKFLNQGIDVNSKDSEGMSPLHYALERKQSDIARLLVDAGADIEIKDNEGRTPLHYAASIENIEMLELLISKGATINSWTHDNETPLGYAIDDGNFDAARFLLMNKAKANVEYDDEFSPLGLAISSESLELVELLVAYGARTDDTIEADGHEYTMEQYAKEYGTDEIARYLRRLRKLKDEL